MAGVAAGFINTLAGGGSMLTLPALMLLGLPADVANGTNRLSIVTQAITGVHGFHRQGKLQLQAAGAVVGWTVLGAVVGAFGAAVLLPREWVKPVLLGTMLAMAVVMLLRPKMLAPEEGAPHTLRERPLGALGLFVAGVYGGFVQAGVGFVLLATLGGVLRYDLVRANALKLACVLVYGTVALAVFAYAGQVDWVPAAVLAVATPVGSLLGVRFAIGVKPKALRAVVFLAVVASCVAAFLK